MCSACENETREDHVITRQVPNLPAGTEDVAWMDQYVSDRARRRLGDAFTAVSTSEASSASKSAQGLQ